VLSREVVVTDIDPRHWAGWFGVVVPPGLRERPRWALAVLDGDPPRVERLIVAGHGARGAVDPAALPLPVTAAGLRACARTLDVGAVVAIERRVIAELAAKVEPRLSIDLDPVAQGLVVLRALKQRSGRGIWTEPPLLDLLPAPGYDALQRSFDLLIPDDSALCAYLIADDRRSVESSIIAVKRRGDIAHVTTHAAIADRIGEAALARDWPTAYKKVVKAVGERLARPCLAVFLERATVDKIVVGPPDTLGRELNARRVVIDPAPAWLLGLLGSATVAAVAQRGAQALAKMLPQAARERAADLADRARTAMKESGAHPFALLGFDPIELWHALRHHYRPRPAEAPRRPPAPAGRRR